MSKAEFMPVTGWRCKLLFLFCFDLFQTAAEREGVRKPDIFTVGCSGLEKGCFAGRVRASVCYETPLRPSAFRLALAWR